jgi:hypothetical protein
MPDQEDPNELAHKLAELRAQAATDNLTKSGERFSAQSNAAAKMMIDFYDRLIILNGGTITLSLTIIGMLVKAGHPLPNGKGFIFSSWICFVISLISAILRNWKEPERLVNAEAAVFSHAVTENYSSMLAQAELMGVKASPTYGSKIVDEGNESVRKQLAAVNRLSGFTKWVGLLWAFWCWATSFLCCLSLAMRKGF